MLLELIQSAIKFVQDNVVLIGAVMACVEWLKTVSISWPWVKAWHKILAAFILSFLFVIPSWPVKVTLDLVVHGIAVGLYATGAFQLGASIAAKVGEPKTVAKK